ncbi:sugar ABC transporter substrate-binding protein [Nocardiopsis changdeensis]|uniref:Sugar ABC transporter substrate-binding protein n=1 Tax=Nocardiopsis changdeensis TaxID=2831969 RepID=A0ABX8BRB3_9ACTN|nr:MULTISPECIES: sugar ABC transporter substrate-binding protein [Nocardiopsis]QUX24754.1 sugar ABC transporter substrate-binding protein [Nocardiopsis changdeensis]QYX35141.1 sugar ABC transporter substrate-binding protein [Nocardiopsis sp. MT53]
MSTRTAHQRKVAGGFAAAGAALTLLVSGCGSLTTSGEDAERETHSIEEGFHVGLLLPELQTARYEAFDKPFFEEALAELCPNCELSYANADQDVDEQQTQAQAMLTEGVDVLVLDAVDSAAAAGTVSEAQAQGVPVVAYDRLAQGGVDMYVSFDNHRVGQVQAEALIEALEERGTAGEGQIVMVNGSPTDPNAADFKAGAHEIFDGQVEIGQEFDTPDWSPDQANSQMEGAITALGVDEIVGVYSANDGMASGIIAALRSAGVDVDDLPPVTGQDAELAGIQRIIAGEQYMTVYKAIQPEAQIAAAMAVALATGTDPELGEYNLVDVEDANGETVPSVLLEPIAVTEENVGDTVVSDGIYSIEEICTDDYADTDFCQEAL